MPTKRFRRRNAVEYLVYGLRSCVTWESFANNVFSARVDSDGIWTAHANALRSYSIRYPIRLVQSPGGFSRTSAAAASPGNQGTHPRGCVAGDFPGKPGSTGDVSGSLGGDP